VITSNFLNCYGTTDCFGSFSTTNSGTYIGCSASTQSFAGISITGSFFNCIGGDFSFTDPVTQSSGAIPTISGKFVGCTGRIINTNSQNTSSLAQGCFGYNAHCSGATYLNCSAGPASFHAVNTAVGTPPSINVTNAVFQNCSAGDLSFVPANATLSTVKCVKCTAGSYSFAYFASVTGRSTAKFSRCDATQYSFPQNPGSINSVCGTTAYTNSSTTTNGLLTMCNMDTGVYSDARVALPSGSFNTLGLFPNVGGEG
jgi:hypothetical protein